MQHHLADLAAGQVPTILPARDPELDRFLKSLATAWQIGEVRPTHRARPKPPRDWRTRVNPFETAWPLVCRWLETQPDRTAKELFRRLQIELPGAFPDSQLRTLQRRVQEWRASEAKRLILAQPDTPVLGHDVAAVAGS